MVRTYEVMTHSLASCAPDASIAYVAAIMRDRDIGNVLVVEDGKLCGIVTDRDLALQALTGKDDPLQTPVSKFMSTRVITGEATWSLGRVAKVMARHQIRRLPIVQEGQLIGIISLGDVARYEGRKDFVTRSLQAISMPIGANQSVRSGPGMPTLIGFGLAALLASTMAWLTWNQFGQRLQEIKARTRLYHTIQQVVTDAQEGSS